MAKVITFANTVSLSGIVVDNFQTRQDGNIVAFRIAHGFGRDKTSLFINVTAFVKGFKNRGGSVPVELLTKGSKVLVEGKLSPNDWTDRDGNKHHDITLIALSIVNNSADDDQVPADGVEPSGNEPIDMPEELGA